MPSTFRHTAEENHRSIATGQESRKWDKETLKFLVPAQCQVLYWRSEMLGGKQTSSFMLTTKPLLSGASTLPQTQFII